MKKNNKKELISIIVPVYNLDVYLEQCLASILGQTYDNLEVILVDDGSTDNSRSIIEAFRNKDERINAVYQENHGESNARNTGIRAATGEYIAFVDCDDWIEPDMYEILIHLMKKYDSQMSAASWIKEFDSESIPIKNKYEVKDGIITRDELLRYIYIRDIYPGFAYIWDKVFKRDLLQRPNGSDIFFDESMSLGGDVLFLAEIAVNTERAVYIDKPLYHYRQRQSSGCHTEDLDKMRSWIGAYEKILDVIKNKGVEPETVSYIKRFLAYHSSNAAEEAIKQNNLLKKDIFQKLMKEYENEYCAMNKEYPDRIDRFNKLLSI